MRILLAPTAFILFLLFAAGSVQADAGTVISMNPGVRAESAGKSRVLQIKDGVNTDDTVLTDATGKAQIIFTDDSTVTLGKSSNLNIREYADSGSNSAFNAHLAQGIARFITGKVVEQNPKGFTVTTPEANVGIRGTIFTVLTLNGQTTVFVENTVRKEVYVNNILVPQGYKITLPSTTLRPEPISEQDKTFIELGCAIDRGRNRILDEGAQAVAINELGDVNLPMQQISQNLAPTTATVQGSLASTSGFAGFSGQFSFDVDLNAGQISNAAMSGSGTSGIFTYSFNGSGGTGTVTGANFAISGFQGPAMAGAMGSSTLAPTTTMNGSGDMSAVGGTVSGTYQVDSIITPIDLGTFNGARIQ